MSLSSILRAGSGSNEATGGRGSFVDEGRRAVVQQDRERVPIGLEGLRRALAKLVRQRLNLIAHRP